jgi:ABC-2 type transport system ATP-binding protein
VSYAVRTEGLTKDYRTGFWKMRPYRALDHLDLEVEAGHVHGFLGPNGAGKTTTLKLLMQLIFPTSGRAELLGRPVGDLDVRRRLGYLPEHPYFYDYLTAEELLTYFASLVGLRGAARTTRVVRLLDEVGIGAERRLQLRRFSKGMLQRVGLAQALLNDPELVILDEPMSGLDPLGRRHVRELILRLRDQGRTIFFSSHILADAEALCHKVAIMAAGRLVASGSVAEIVAHQAVKGWELVVESLNPAALQRLGGVVVRSTRISDARYALELSPERPPERVLSELVAYGAHLVSLNPIRETLEDFFVRKVAQERREIPWRQQGAVGA